MNGIHYELRGKLGDGAAGLVRKGRNVSTNEQLAVKFLAPDPKYIDPKMFDDVAQRFKREGERGTRLQHEQLIRILAYSDNTEGGAFLQARPTNPFIVMEYVKGQTLESYIRGSSRPRRGTFTVDRPRLCVAIQLAAALEYLRDRKLVHRDVKPANVFLTKSKGPGGWKTRRFWGDEMG